MLWEKNRTFLHLISFTKMLLLRRFVSCLIIQVIFKLLIILISADT